MTTRPGYDRSSAADARRHMDEILSEPKSYQGIIAGVIAFVGVIVALVGNASLAWLDRWSKRQHEANVMRSALLAELAFLRNSYEKRLQLLSRGPPYFDVPANTATEVYDRLLDRIGLLTMEQSGKVVHAYIAAKHLQVNLRRNELTRPPPTDLGDPGPGHIRVTGTNVIAARDLHSERLEIFKAAIASLGGK